jgi:hypothetical protein
MKELLDFSKFIITDEKHMVNIKVENSLCDFMTVIQKKKIALYQAFHHISSQQQFEKQETKPIICNGC